MLESASVLGRVDQPGTPAMRTSCLRSEDGRASLGNSSLSLGENVSPEPWLRCCRTCSLGEGWRQILSGFANYLTLQRLAWEEWNDSVPADLPLSSKPPVCFLLSNSLFLEDKGTAPQLLMRWLVESCHLGFPSEASKVAEPGVRSTYTRASGSEGEMMQLCMGVNGRNVAPCPPFFLFSSSSVLKEKQRETE